MRKYQTIESWASSLGYIVERTSEGFVWHLEEEPPVNKCATVAEVLEAILGRIRSAYEGGE